MGWCAVHELAIAQSVVESVLDHTGDRTVTTVRLQVGRLAGVVPESLSFCFELAASGTTLDGADLIIAQPAGRACCHTCGAEFCLDDLILLCPCGSADVDVTAGRELQVMSVEVV